MELFNANHLVIDTLAACTVIIYRRINMLGKRLYIVLYNARPPSVASWC